MVEFDSCEALGNKRAKSVIVIDISFKSNAGLEGRYGSDQDGLANIGATTAPSVRTSLVSGVQHPRLTC